jgi:hypothetical protein
LRYGRGRVVISLFHTKATQPSSLSLPSVYFVGAHDKPTQIRHAVKRSSHLLVKILEPIVADRNLLPQLLILQVRPCKAEPYKKANGEEEAENDFARSGQAKVDSI